MRGGSCTRQWLRSTVVRRRSAWTLLLLRQAAQLPSAQRIPSAMRRIWLRCLKRRSQKSRRTGWSKFETLTARASPANSAHHSNLGASTGMARVTLGESRVREICPPGSVRAKAEWLSYSTTILSPDSAVHWHSVQVSRATDASWGRDVATSVVKCALMRQQEKNADILRSEEPIRENRSVLAARLF